LCEIIAIHRKVQLKGTDHFYSSKDDPRFICRHTENAIVYKNPTYVDAEKN